MHSFGVICIGTSDTTSLISWCIKEADESVTRVDSLAPLMHHDLCDFGSLIQIRNAPKERTLCFLSKNTTLKPRTRPIGKLLGHKIYFLLFKTCAVAM